MSSKKFSKSKKTDGGNVPNFVFSFSGSQPASPLASPGGIGFGSNPSSPASTSFNFGNTSSTSQTSLNFQPFAFGEASNTPTTNTATTPSATTSAPAFQFGLPSSTSSPQFGAKRGQSELSLTAPDRGSLRKTDSESSFSLTPSANSGAPAAAFNFGAKTGSAPSFGTANSTGGPPALNTQPSFGSVGSQSSNTSFSAPAISNNTSAPTFVTLTTNPTTSAFGTPTATSATPTFGTPVTANATSTATNSASTPAVGGFTFNSPSTAAKTTPAASPFGSTPSTASKPTFTFGASPTTTPASTTSSSEKPATTTAPTFSFGSPASTDKPATTTASPFGNTPPTSTASSTSSLGGFSFGKPATTESTSTSTTSTPAATTSSPFTFGAPSTSTSTSTTTSKPAEEKSTASPSPFTFGPPKTSAETSTSTPATSTTPGLFSFGAPASTTATSTSTATTSSSAPSTSLFSLGTVAGGDKDKKAGSAVTSTPFTFGSNPPSTTPAAVVPNKPNAFSFDKILEDLVQLAAQPPSTMFATLLPSAIAAIQRNQIVTQTNFKIDNIAYTTRFMELPQEAQKELDELEKYIRLEGQRSEYIVKHKLPQHVDVMAKAEKDTQMLSQQLDAHTSTLKGQMVLMESLYDKAKTQTRYANEASAIIEACKHPGNNSRWLFGHANDDEYFSQLALQLAARLEEYKECVWEIESTVESWAHSKVQSPQDIADIMRAQNQAFLSLSDKVAALHEKVETEMKHFNQYKSLYI